jgi:hypothetical protein
VLPELMQTGPKKKKKKNAEVRNEWNYTSRSLYFGF